MAKVKVGGPDGLIDQFLVLVSRAPSTDVASAQRKDALKIFDRCEKAISQFDGLLYLVRRGLLTMASGASSAALPTAPPMDFGKDFTVKMPSGRGDVDIVSAGDFTAPAYPSRDVIEAVASKAYLAIDSADGLMKLWFDWTNPGPGSVDFPIVFQQAVIDLVDGTAATNVSLLPEGYELTILLPMAEEFTKTRRSQPSVEALTGELKVRMEAFYGKYRSNKQQAVTDRNRERRKVESDELTPFMRGS